MTYRGEIATFKQLMDEVAWYMNSQHNFINTEAGWYINKMYITEKRVTYKEEAWIMLPGVYEKWLQFMELINEI